MKKQVYLAGALSCYEPGDDYPYKWRIKAKDLLGEDFKVFDPSGYYTENATSDYEREIMKYELRMTKKSEVVLVNLKDLNKSVGTNDEILYAYLNNIPVVGFLENENELSKIHPWKRCEQIDRIYYGKYGLENAVEYIKEFYD